MAESEIMTEQRILSGLESFDISKVYDCLINLRQYYVSNVPKMRKFALKSNLMKLVIQHLEHPKLCNIALSVISNACMDDLLRNEVLNCDEVIASLNRIMKGLANNEIQNRACRALGNIALSKMGLFLVLNSNPVSNIVSFLSSVDNIDYQLTALRTLRIFGGDKKKRQSLVKDNAIYAIAKLLSSNHSKVTNNSLKTLAFIMPGCTTEYAQQMRRAEALPVLVRLYCKNDDIAIKDSAMICLENLARVSGIREELGKAGAFKLFIDIAKSYGHVYSPKAQSAVVALCFCCGEYWEGKEICRLGGLPLLINILRLKSYQSIHHYIISALMHLCYLTITPKTILKLNLLSVLMDKLKDFIEDNKTDHLAIFKSKLKPSVLEEEEDKKNKVVTRDFADTWQFIDTVKSKKIKFESSLRPLRSSSTIFSIHSPTYQGVQYSEPNTPSCSHNSYTSYVSPIGSSTQQSSPEQNSFDWSLGSPVSCASILSPWSPSSSSNDNQNMCWSPVLSSRSNTPESIHEDAECTDSEICAINEDNIDGSCPTTKSVQGLALAMSNKTDDANCGTVKKNIFLNSNITCASNRFYKSGTSSFAAIAVDNLSDETSNSVSLWTASNNLIDMKERTSDCKPESNVFSECLQLMSNVVEKKSTETVKKHSEKSLDEYIFLLLSHLLRQLLHAKSPINSLNFVIIIEYLAYVTSPNMRAINILKNLINEDYAFQELIGNDLIGHLDRIMCISHEISNCIHCEAIQSTRNELLQTCKNVVSCDRGLEQIVAVLSQKDRTQQLNCLYAISRLMDSKLNLCKLLIKTNGLTKLIDFLSMSENKFFSKASITLSYIWCMLDKTVITSDVLHSVCGVYCKYSYMRNNRMDDVTLLCQDAVEVRAVKSQLCGRSDYFRSLLDGHFVEAKQETVSVSTISGAVISHVMHFLHGCQIGWCPVLSKLAFSDLTKLLFAGDFFLLESLKVQIQSLLLSKLEHKSALEVYKTCKTYCTPTFTDTLLCHVIRLGHENENDYLICLRELISSYKEEVTDHIKSFVSKRYK